MNITRENRDEFVANMAREHRTNQQIAAPAIFGVLKQWANDYATGNFDARNEATCRLAFELVDAFRVRTTDTSLVDPIEADLFDTLQFPYI